MTRRTFQRAGEAERRKDLIAATLDSISEHGLEGATVRDIAARAGVTGGLIRHYFSGKDEMVQAAYRDMLAGMTGTALSALFAKSVGAAGLLAKKAFGALGQRSKYCRILSRAKGLAMKPLAPR